MGVRRDRHECRESAGRESLKPAAVRGSLTSRRCPQLTLARPSREIAAAVRGSFKPAVRGRSTPPSAAHPGPPIAGDRIRHSRVIEAAVRGSPRPADHGRSKPPSAAHPSPPFAGDRRRRPWFLQARRSREIDAAVRGSLTSSRRSLLTLGRLECMWQARRPPLTQAQVPWIQSTRHGQECRVYVLLYPQEHFNLPCRVLSTEIHWGRAARLVVATEAIPSRLPLLVVEVEAVAEGPCEGP